MLAVASLFREAVQVTPPSDEVVSIVALPDELLQHIFKQVCNDVCNMIDPRAAVALSRAGHRMRAATQALDESNSRILTHLVAFFANATCFLRAFWSSTHKSFFRRAVFLLLPSALSPGGDTTQRC